MQASVRMISPLELLGMIDNDNRLLRRKDAADYLRVRYGFGSHKTLAKLASTGGGPCYRKAGRLPLYAPADLDAWARRKLSAPVNSTSEYLRAE
jgi:hypothetical protein